MVQYIYEHLFGKKVKHKYKTRLKSHFQYQRHKLQLLNKTQMFMENKLKKLFSDLKVKIKQLMHSKAAFLIFYKKKKWFR